MNRTSTCADIPRAEAESAFSQSVYGYFRDTTKKFAKQTAISFYYVRYTYAELNEEICRVCSALASFGIKKGDSVVCTLPSVPEAVFLMYAVNRIGAIFTGVDCRLKAADIDAIIQKTKPAICFVADFQVKAFSKQRNIPIISIRATNALGGIMPLLGTFADFFAGRAFLKMRSSNIYGYTAFLKNATDTVPEEVLSDGSDVCAYFHTSGTTYGRKCVVLTNSNINASTYQTGLAHRCLSGRVSGEKFLGIMPPFTCYGYTQGVHTPLSLGAHVRLIPLVQKDVKRLLLREKPNHIISVPSHWEGFSGEKENRMDLSFLKTVLVGGDRIDPAYAASVNDIFKHCGSSAELLPGYGLTETASAGTFPYRGMAFGLVGKPLPLTDIKIVDPETGQTLPNGEPGEICISGPSVCQGYFDDRAATTALLKQDESGKIWLHSGDIGCFEADGSLRYCQRIKRMFVRFDGTKVSPYEIEQQMLTCPAVKQCLIVAVKDPDHSHGSLPKAYIVPADGLSARSAYGAVNGFVKKCIAAHMQPAQIETVKKLPYTKYGKIDYFKPEP